MELHSSSLYLHIICNEDLQHSQIMSLADLVAMLLRWMCQSSGIFEIYSRHPSNGLERLPLIRWRQIGRGQCYQLDSFVYHALLGVYRVLFSLEKNQGRAC
jgi:hypothetical protein